MRHQPSNSEQQQLEAFSPSELLHYFLTRVIESEELWGLGDSSNWVMRETGEITSLPVWPYKTFAASCALDDWEDYSPCAVSLEHFVYQLLPVMDKQDIKVEIFPYKTRTGRLMESRELASLLEGMMESGEYYMEG